jgi:helicase SWR1
MPKFGSSLHGFLSSYFSPFEKVTEEAALERQIGKEAVLLERAYKLRQEGRFPPASADITLETLAELRASVTSKRTSKDIWDHVVESATAYARTRKRAVGPHIAGQIAARIKAYWEAQEAKKEKSRVSTEKQLRILARDTIRMVVNEWKKAVFVRIPYLYGRPLLSVSYSISAKKGG